MTNNDVFRSIWNVLGNNESTLVDIFKLDDHPIDQLTISNFLKLENEPGYIECNDEQLTSFLNGLITYRRGKSEKVTTQPQAHTPALTNNIIFKKIRIAFDLKENDLIELMSLADYETSKNELSSIARKAGHKHYRVCSDELLKGLLAGLTFRQWN